MTALYLCSIPFCVTSREGRVSRNTLNVVHQSRQGVTSREGRVSRNNIYFLYISIFLPSRPVRDV